jgi:hypothetical protein
MIDVPGARRSARRLDEFDVLLEKLVDELIDVDAAGCGAGSEVDFHVGFEVDAQF